MGRKIFTKKNILRFVYFAAVIILGNVDFYLIKSGIAKGIVNAFTWFFNFMNQGVPNFVTNLLLLAALGFLVFLSIRIKELLRVGRRDSKEHTENLRSDFEEHKEVFKKVTRDIDKNIRGIRQDLSQIYDKAKRYEEVETKEEFMFILETIGAYLDRRIFKGRLLNLYKKKFSFESRKELILSFNMNITLLKERNLINSVIMAGSVFYVITNEGLKYLRLARVKIKEEKGENSR